MKLKCRFLFPHVAKPHIDVGAVKDITVKHGQPFTIRVPFTGWPIPSAAWELNDKDVVLEDRITPEVLQ